MTKVLVILLVTEGASALLQLLLPYFVRELGQCRLLWTPSALFRRYDKIISKCLGSLSMNMASPVLISAFASARVTCSINTSFSAMVDRRVWKFFPPTLSVISPSPGPCRCMDAVCLLTKSGIALLQLLLFVGSFCVILPTNFMLPTPRSVGSLTNEEEHSALTSCWIRRGRHQNNTYPVIDDFTDHILLLLRREAA